MFICLVNCLQSRPKRNSTNDDGLTRLIWKQETYRLDIFWGCFQYFDREFQTCDKTQSDYPLILKQILLRTVQVRSVVLEQNFFCARS